MADLKQITATIPQFCEMSGLSRGTVYNLIRAKKLKSFCVGRKRLIVLSSYERLVERATYVPTHI